MSHEWTQVEGSSRGGQMDAGAIDEGMIPAPVPGKQPVLRAAGRGAMAGVRWASFFALPLAILGAVWGLVASVFGLAAGQGFALARTTPGAAGFYGACLLYGAAIGGVVGLVGGLIRRRRGASAGAPGWWRVLTRPVVRIASRRAEARRPAGEPAPSRSSVWFRRQRILVRVLLVGGAVVLVVAGGLGWQAGRVVYRRLDAAIAAADADDPNWRLDDLMAARAEIPDEANSALVVAEVVAMLPQGWPPSPLRSPSGTATGPPTPLRIVLDRMPDPAGAARLDDEAAATIRAALDEHAEAVALARTLAGAGPGRHELEIPANPISTLLGETQASREVARLLCSDAAVRAHDGRIDEALDSCRAILGVNRSIGDEPTAISGLVRIAVILVALQSARRALSQGEASDAALARLQADVLAEFGQARPMLVTTLRGERAMFAALAQRLRDGEVSISSLSAEPGRAPLPPDEPGSAIAPWGRLMFEAQLAVGLDWMNRLVAIARRPGVDRPPLVRAWRAEIERVKVSKLEFWGAILPLLMIPSMEPTLFAHARCEAELGATAVLLAAERHRLKHGAWPDSVAAIDPALLPAPPPDPFTGRPYRVDRPAGQFLVHSVGPNLRDEHGAYEPRKILQGGPDDLGTGAWDPDRRRQPPEPPPAPN